MPKTKISEFSATPGNNTDIDGINIAEGCAPSGINDAIRELMSQLKDFQAGTAGDSFNGPVGTTTAAAGAFTTLSASGAVTLSGGAANGVPYLNGSKVLTTGSALQFDGSNLGLGVTPSAWGGGQVAFQVKNASLSGFSNSAYMMANTYYDGTNEKYIASSFAGKYAQASGAHIWYNAPSGTAGNAISFTQAMTLDASGNLGIGTTSPGAVLHLNRAGSTDVYTYYQNGNGGVFLVGTNGSTGEAFLYNGANKATVFHTNGIERMRIDAAGNVGIGTSSPSYLLDVSKNQNASTVARVQNANTGASAFSVLQLQTGASNYTNLQVNSAGNYFQMASSGVVTSYIDFDTQIWRNNAGTERMRIDSSGNLLVGDTGSTVTTGRLRVLQTSTGGDYIARLQSNAASNVNGLSVYYSGASPNGTGSPFLFCEDSTTLRMSVRSNGGIANFSGNNVNLSDRREKTNFAPAGEYLSKICAIPVQTFNYIDQNMEEDPGLTLGVVAQDVQAVAPELVMESNWGTAEEPKMRLSIYQTDLQYALMKSIQELKAELDSVKAELAQLKGA